MYNLSVKENKHMPTVEIEINEFKNAKVGSLLIKTKDKWKPISKEELLRAEKEELEKIKSEMLTLKGNQKHYKVYAKSHFMNVYAVFLAKVIAGTIECPEDEELLKLDEKVLNNELSVEEAIEKHEYLKKAFAELYLKDESEKLGFNEV